MQLCKLCLAQEANQRNSHIIPKFLKGSVSNEKRQMLLFNLKTQKEHLKQELPRVDYLLCPDCEGKLSKIERHCNLHFFSKFHKVDSSRIFPLITTTYEGKSVSYREALPYLNSYLFTLFILSIIWRAGNSNCPFNILLPSEFNEKIRQQLSDYFNDENNRYDNYFSYVIISPEQICKGSLNNISISYGGNSIIILSLGNFVINFSLDMHFPKTELSYIMYASQNNNSTVNIKIGIGSINNWKKHNETLISAAIKNSRKQ